MRHFLYLLLSILIVPSRVYAQADTAAYAVAYVEVMPSSRGAAVNALKQYRDASRKEEGCIRIELFEQMGRPGHFAVIETWADPKALEAHGAAANTKQLRGTLQPIRLSDYDQRPYKTLTVGSPPSPANDRNIYVITHVDIAGPQAAGPDTLRRVAEASRKEEGSLRFDILQHAMRANHFTVVEAWPGQKAVDTHAAAAHTKQYREAMAPMLGSPLDERLYKAVE